MIPPFYFLFSFSPFHFPHCSGKTNELQLTNICNKFLMLWQHVRWDVSIVGGSPGLSACPIGFTLHPCGNVPKRTRPAGTHVLVRSSLLKHRPIVPDISLEWFAVGLFFHVPVFHRPQNFKRHELCFIIARLPSLYQMSRSAVVKLG